MKLRHYFLFTFIAISFSSCEMTQETTFNVDGGGQFSLGIDLSPMVQMGMMFSDEDFSDSDTEKIDLDFSEFLEKHKDSIAALPTAEQDRLKLLENYKIHILGDVEEQKFVLKIDYDFNDIKDLSKFGEKLSNQNIEELEIFNDLLLDDSDDKDGLTKISDAFAISYNGKKFSAFLNSKYLQDIKSKDTEKPLKDNPMADLIKYKVIYTFPTKIKKSNNNNGIISADKTSIEFSGGLKDILENPNFYDVELELK